MFLSPKKISLKQPRYYQERRLASMGLNPIETDEELEALRAVGDRAGGRRYGSDDYEWGWEGGRGWWG